MLLSRTDGNGVVSGRGAAVDGERPRWDGERGGITVSVPAETVTTAGRRVDAVKHERASALLRERITEAAVARWAKRVTVGSRNRVATGGTSRLPESVVAPT